MRCVLCVSYFVRMYNTVQMVCLSQSTFIKFNSAELHLSGLTGTANHPDMQKIRIIGYFFDKKLHWQFEVRLLLLRACTCV